MLHRVRRPSIRFRATDGTWQDSGLLNALAATLPNCSAESPIKDVQWAEHPVYVDARRVNVQ